MKLNKKWLIIPGVLGVAAVAGTILATGVSASAGELKSKLAEKLGIEESQVESAMDQIKAEDRQERQAKIEENLQEAVDDGVITSEQKDSLIEKREEIQTKMQELQDEMANWYEEQGIDESELRDYGIGMGMGRGSHGMMD